MVNGPMIIPTAQVGMKVELGSLGPFVGIGLMIYSNGLISI